MYGGVLPMLAVALPFRLLTNGLVDILPSDAVDGANRIMDQVRSTLKPNSLPHNANTIQ